jgi:hypothetical protein
VSGQPDQLEVALRLGLQGAARPHPVEVYEKCLVVALQLRKILR